MVQLVTRRSALVLYGVLLVLPTVVLGGLLWRQIEEDHQAQIAAVPGDTSDAARRLKDGIERRVRDLVEREGLRPFYHYKKTYFKPGTIGTKLAFVPSPLAEDLPPEGIRAWFTYAYEDGSEQPHVEIFSGKRDADPEWPAQREAFERATMELALHDARQTYFTRLARLGTVRVDTLPLPVAAINASEEQDFECLERELPALQSLQDESLDVQVSRMHLRFYRQPDGTPRVVASRRVKILSNESLQGMPPCFENLFWGLDVMQGFYLDPDWLFARLPATVATQILDPSQVFEIAPNPSLLPARSSRPRLHVGSVQAEIHPVRDLGFETYARDDEDFGRIRIVVNTDDLDARFRSQARHFLGVAAMLVLSLATGLALLLRSVRRDLETAQRTENFVAAVTHELRTPLSAIRLHGEMLQDGWVRDDGKRQEYYRRIVRETDRLETLVERVLEKSRLSTTDAHPEPGDLNAVIEGLGPALLRTGTEKTADDVVFDLALDLPETMIVPEGVRSIVTNLVENARKYAAPKGWALNGKEGDPARPAPEPIRVATAILGRDPVLEVRDRGPGIPREERAHIFDAFYRVGNESTRTTKGTGLGLHLVALHCSAMGARVQALDREGGGTIFRVTFERAPSEDGDGRTVPSAHRPGTQIA